MNEEGIYSLARNLPKYRILAPMKGKAIAISLISKLNYFRLGYRSLLLIGMLSYYIYTRVNNLVFFDYAKPMTYAVLGFITLSFVIEMIGRMIPAKTSSMGSQKQFKRNYLPSGEEEPELQSWKRTLAIFLVWIGLNGIFGALYFLHLIDDGILALISLFYSVCDMICILFFCPFQTWIMKNRCCGSCRIYNWDFAMIFTPLIFILVSKGEQGYSVNYFALVLVAASLILLLIWEVTYIRHRERFSDKTNLSLLCVNCKEKLCAHKKQLQKYLVKYHRLLRQRLNMAQKSEKDA